VQGYYSNYVIKEIEKITLKGTVIGLHDRFLHPFSEGNTVYPFQYLHFTNPENFFSYVPPFLPPTSRKLLRMCSNPTVKLDSELLDLLKDNCAICDEKGQTPFHKLAQCGNIKLIDEFEKQVYGTRIDFPITVKDFYGKTPYDYISKQNYLKVKYLNEKILELQKQCSERIATLEKYQTKDKEYVLVESDIWLRADYLLQKKA
jgi:hypothetical protein